MKEIIIKGKTFLFKEVELTYENAAIINCSVAKDNLLDFKKVLETRHVPFLIMHGTLLGAIRENDFIKHDIDIDTCVMNEKALVNAIPSLAKVGLNLCRYEKGLIYSFIRDSVYIDVYIVNKINGLIRPFYVRYLGNVIPRKYFRNIKEISFINSTFKIPNHTEELIKFWYGEKWKTPISNCPSNDKSIRGEYLEKNYRFLFRPLHKIIK